MITIVFGKLGSYKTMYSVLSMKAVQQYIPTKDLYANFAIEGGRRIHCWEHLTSLHDCCAALDEAHMFMNSRNFKDKNNIKTTEFGLNTRKQNVDIWIISPRLASIDVNLREIADQIVYMRLEGQYIVKEVYEHSMITQDLELVGGNVMLKSDLRAFFGLYDTREKPTNFMLESAFSV